MKSCRNCWLAILLAGILPLLSACVSLTAEPRALVYEAAGVKLMPVNCGTAMQDSADASRAAPG